MQYSPIQTSPFTLRMKLKMRLWGIVEATVFRWSPTAFRGWRRLLIRAFGGQISSSASIHPKARIDCPWNLSMADRASVGEDSWIYCLAQIVIRENACVAQRVLLLTGSHDIGDPTFRLILKPIEIGAGAWVAAAAIVLPGVRIGEMSVVGAGSVVARDVRPWTVVCGSPAREIKRREIRE